MAPVPSADQGTGCGDAPDAAHKLASFLGLSGRDLETLTSCQADDVHLGTSKDYIIYGSSYRI